MQDYMKALQKQFDRQEFDDLNALVESTHEEFKENMDICDRKKLRRLLDAQNTLLEEARLSSFTAGFKLTLGNIGELGASYSFDTDKLTANEVNTLVGGRVLPSGNSVDAGSRVAVALHAARQRRGK